MLDYSGTNKWIQMKRDLGVTEELDELFDGVWKKHRSRICIDCDVDTIVPEFKEKVGVEIPDGYSMLGDFVDRFEVNHTIHTLAQKAKEKYKVGLLTNMYPRMLSMIRENKLIPELEWDSVVDSSIVGFQKPENGIYEVAEQKAQTDPSQIFFVDNSPEHIEAATKRGWKTLLYDPQNPKESSNKLAQILDIILA